MKRIELNRRDFNKLTVAAFGGVVAGTAIGCGKDADEAGGDTTDTAGTDSGTTDNSVAAAESPLLSEPHVCRGLNACQSLGKTKGNACAGQSACHTVKTHACNGQNACEGRGGCGDTVGQNSCETKGECAVPLSQEAWDTARAALKVALEKKGKKLGNPTEMGPPDA